MVPTMKTNRQPESRLKLWKAGVSLLIVVLSLVFIPSIIHAENRIVIIRGPLLLGTETSGIDGLTPDGDFVNGTDVYKDILSSCDVLKECEIIGFVDNKGWIQHVISARTIDTSVEPSNHVIKEAACWASSLGKLFKNGQLTIKSLEIYNYRLQFIHGKTIWRFDYEMTFEEREKSPPRIRTGSVKMEKQGETWHYFR